MFTRWNLWQGRWGMIFISIYYIPVSKCSRPSMQLSWDGHRNARNRQKGAKMWLEQTVRIVFASFLSEASDHNNCLSHPWCFENGKASVLKQRWQMETLQIFGLSCLHTLYRVRQSHYPALLRQSPTLSSVLPGQNPLSGARISLVRSCNISEQSRFLGKS